jgi:hypothetical protein
MSYDEYSSSYSNQYQYTPYVDTKPIFKMIDFLTEDYENYTKTRYQYKMTEFGLKIEPEFKIHNMDRLFVHNGFKDGSRYIYGYFINNVIAYMTMEWYHGFDISNDYSVVQLNRLLKSLEDTISVNYKQPDFESMYYFTEEFITVSENKNLESFVIKNLILDEKCKAIWYNDKTVNKIISYYISCEPKTIFIIIVPSGSPILNNADIKFVRMEK